MKVKFSPILVVKVKIRLLLQKMFKKMPTNEMAIQIFAKFILFVLRLYVI